MNQPNITAMHEAMKTALAAKFTGVNVSYYARPGDIIKTPALLIELDEIETEDGGDIGTEQLNVNMRWNVYCVHDFKEGNKLSVRVFAAQVLAFVRGKRFGSAGPIVADGAFPDRMQKGNPISQEQTEEYEVMRVAMHQEAVLGDDVWDFDGVFPTQVFAGIDPHVGPAHEGEYLELT